MANASLPTLGKGPGGGARDRFKPREKPKDAGKTLLRIGKLYLHFGKGIALSALFTLVGGIASVFVPYLVGLAFNTFDLKTSTVAEGLIYILLIIAAVHICNFVLSLLSSFIMLKVSQQLVYTLRKDFYGKMQRLPLAFYDSNPHGDTMSRLTNDVDNISSTIAGTTVSLVSSIFTLVGSLIIMLTLNLTLTLTVLVSVPLVALLTKLVAGRSRRYFSMQQRSLGKLGGLVEESITGLKMVKAFNRREFVLEDFSKTNEELFESSKQAQIWSGFMMPLMNVISNLSLALVSLMGGYLCISGFVPMGTVVSFLSYSKQFAAPLNTIAGMFNTIQSALAGAERVFQILDLQEEPGDGADSVSPGEIKGQVEFCGVDFSYDGKTPVLKDVSFTVESGMTAAIVGETGGGKTTIVNLLTRYYDPLRGQIFIDGVDLTKIKRRRLREYFSVVLQDTSLFTGTVMDNIRYSRPEASDLEVIDAAKLAHAHEFILRLPMGYKTTVSGVSDSLSQGQRQLLAIARAVLCGAPILILDEATSSVDTKTEKEIQKGLTGLMQNRTSFLIAHRLSTIRDADRIFVVDGGTIAEQGSHDELMEKKGRYFEMVMSQLGKI